MIELRPTFRFDSWRRPLCTKFLNLEPLGVGTVMQESLPSYIDRLAAKHFITNGYLFDKELGVNRSCGVGYLGVLSKALLTHGKVTDKIQKALTLDTSIGGLDKLLFPNLSRVVSLGHSTRRKAAWCPMCLQECETTGQAVHRPWIWSLQGYKCCHIHKIALRTQCPKCQKKVNHLAHHPWSRFCHRCNHDLYEPEALSVTPSAHDIFCTTQVADLVSKAGTGKLNLLPANLQMTLTVFGGYKELVKLTGITKTSFHYWAFNGSAPKLENLLHLASVFNISVYDWLATPVDPYGLLRTRLEFLQSKRGPSPRFRTAKKGRKHRNVEEIRVALLELLKAPNPMSLSKSVQRVGYTVDKVRKNFPDLCHQIEERYATRCREYKEMMLQKKVQLVRDAIKELQQQSKPVKPHTVTKLLKERGATCIWVLRDIATAELKMAKILTPGG